MSTPPPSTASAPFRLPPAPVSPLCIADDATFWPWLKWPDFAAWDRPAETLVVVPIAGLADAFLGHPLDAEETVLMTVLKAAAESKPADLRMLVVPPLRFVLGPGPGCAFPISPPVAHAQLREVVESILSVRFRRIVLLNASPWNEDLIDAAARDLRISHGAQMFCINLSALGLDFHPTRSTSRRPLQTLLTGLYGREPRPRVRAPTPNPLLGGAFPEIPEPWDDLATSSAKTGPTVRACGDRLVSLFLEIRAHPALPQAPFQ